MAAKPNRALTDDEVRLSVLSPRPRSLQKADEWVLSQPDKPMSSEEQDRAPMADPAAKQAGADAKVEAAAVTPKRSRKLLIAGLVASAVAIAGGWYGYNYWTVGRFMVATDDAYVRARTTTLATKVSGYVSRVVVEDNVKVRAGDVIATIDDGDYKLAVDAARDKVATQEATVLRFGPQIDAQRAMVEQAKSQIVSAKAAQVRAQSEYDRQQALAGKEFASRQTLEQTLANRDQANANALGMQAGLDNAQANVEVLRAQQNEAARGLDELKTALARAERDLAFTQIRAPVDGVFGNRAVQTGDFVQIGQRVAALVPLDDVYVDANFKETQLARLKAGQKVAITVDAAAGEKFEGTVASLSPASGAIFSLLPPENATGNFTKIVQRVPVRITVPAAVAAQNILRPGLSVIVSVDTRTNAQEPPAVKAAGAQ